MDQIKVEISQDSSTEDASSGDAEVEDLPTFDYT